MTRSCELDQDEELFNVGNIEGVKRSLQDSVKSIKIGFTICWINLIICH